MEKLCERLVETYNTNELNEAPIVLQQAFYNEAKRMAEEPECIFDRKVLMSLIENHFNKKKPNPDFIVGPVTLTCHWSKRYDKMIYIFGEYHIEDKGCDVFGVKDDKDKMVIEDFLFELFKTTDVFIDFYFEISAMTMKSEKYLDSFIYPEEYDSLVLIRMDKKFRKCVQKETRDDIDCRLTRTHFFDVRKENGVMHGFANTIHEASFIISNKKTTEKVKVILFREYLLKKIKHFNMLFDILVDPDPIVVKQFWIEKIYENEYVAKELLKITDSEIIIKIKEYIDKTILEEAKKYSKMWIHFVPYIISQTSDDDIFLDAAKRIIVTCVNFFTYVSDVYTIARIFKDFNIKKVPWIGAQNQDQPQKAHNIIIYSGIVHSVHYRDFIEFLGFEEFGSTGKDIKGVPQTCIDMRNFPRPFFSNYNIDDNIVFRKMSLDLVKMEELHNILVSQSKSDTEIFKSRQDMIILLVKYQKLLKERIKIIKNPDELVVLSDDLDIIIQKFRKLVIEQTSVYKKHEKI